MYSINIPYRLSTFTYKWLLPRGFKKSVTAKTNQKLILEPLEREIIQVNGEEVVPFLQGLITNDVKHLCSSTNKAIYAMFLNKTGRVMYDVILYSASDPTKILIDCDKNVANDLQRHLKLYRVRRKIDVVSLNQELNVWQAFNPNKEAQNIMDAVSKERSTDLTISTDPRLKQLGIRIIAKSDQTFSDLSILFNSETVASDTAENSFRFHRYNLGIAEGVIDIPPGKCIPLEANCDILNGVSFNKGCYIGQELTARVHHTGMVRKRHMPIGLNAPLSTDTATIVENEAGDNCGVIYGSLGNRALGLLRIEKAFKAKELLVNGNICVTERPPWWPQELYPNVLKEIRKGI